MKLLELLPVGEIDGRLLRELAPALANTFRVPSNVLAARLDPGFAEQRERMQYHSSDILETIEGYGGRESWRILGVTRRSP